MNYSIVIKFTLSLFLFLLVSCAASVEEEAKDAASFAKKSIEYTVKRDLEKAEEYFTKSKIIRDKYNDSDSRQEFYELYTKHLNPNLENE